MCSDATGREFGGRTIIPPTSTPTGAKDPEDWIAETMRGAQPSYLGTWRRQARQMQTVTFELVGIFKPKVVERGRRTVTEWTRHGVFLERPFSSTFLAKSIPSTSGHWGL